MNNLYMLIALSMPISYLTSLVYCVSNQEWLATIAMHVFLFPVGILHGYFVWFGASWF